MAALPDNIKSSVYVIATRPYEDSKALMSELTGQGLTFTPIISPLLKLTRHDDYFVDFEQYRFEHIIFSSKNAVRFLQRSYATQRPNLRAWCVGAQTEAAALEAGYHIAQTAQTAQGLYDVMMQNPAFMQGSALYVRGHCARFDFEQALQTRGVSCLSQVVYAQEEQSLSAHAGRALAGSGRCIVPLYSPKTAALFCRSLMSLPPELKQGCRLALQEGRVSILVMSEAIAAECPVKLRSRLEVVLEPTGAHMRDAVVAAVRAMPVGGVMT